ncbi:hypothetical protein GSI_07795 [Ganoderma sinense ZZ0214-1]|uniref:Uncharacterized protein n=1 Tax=Ganoderma sinense ZZ0214-1 TaxID=1077348 RepID=A0A2G8S8Z3_9APHY|nr:hypothetical protein GSI_07639 [Ganoderma sinense ZZ0214-1]PIL30217.1 hypothetical protein GSI_07795 [Ganoderma sinense ZZ0214-1]
MPPRANSSKKRACSPDEPKPADKPQTRSSKRVKKDVTSTASTSTSLSTTSAPAAKSRTRPKAVNVVEDSAVAPSFHGNFDLYAMSLPFLSSVFAPKRDYAALLKTIRTYQAKPDNTAQIFLPEDTSKSGRFESLAVLDPIQEWPFDLALRSLARKPTLTFTAREMSDNAKFFSGAGAGSPAKGPGVTAAVALAYDQCGIASSKGAFKMRRAWVSADGRDEVFEGVFSVSIIYSSLYRGKCDETACRETFAFWGVRARVGEDGKEIGLGPGTGRRW